MPTLLVACSVSREFCDENCVSFMWPCTVLANGMVPNDVPSPLPVLVVPPDRRRVDEAAEQQICVADVNGQGRTRRACCPVAEVGESGGAGVCAEAATLSSTRIATDAD
mgnify:CR=1 FL=1